VVLGGCGEAAATPGDVEERPQSLRNGGGRTVRMWQTANNTGGKKEGKRSEVNHCDYLIQTLAAKELCTLR